MHNIERKISAIRLFVLDFDGVFTDNRVIIDQDGRESVICDRSDSLGLKLLRTDRPDITVMVISKETNPVVRARCDKLHISCRTGIDNKLTTLQEIVADMGLTPSDVAYMGNDINDLECLTYAGISIAVADSDPRVLTVADYVTRKNGGRGAIREIVDMILNANSST